MKKILLTLSGAASGISLFAQVAPGDDVARAAVIASAPRPGLMEIYSNGGNFSHFIAFLLLAAIVYGLVRGYQLYFKEKLDAKNLYLKLKGHIRSQNYEEAIKIAENFQNTTLGFMFWSGLRVFNHQLKSGLKGRKLANEVEKAFDEAAMQKMPKISGGLFWFEIIGQVATLAGLLGTIYGLMMAFKALGGADPAQATQLLTEGIQAAMGTTFMGLMVAIPTMFIKGALQSRSEKVINDIDEYQYKIINVITASIKE